MLKKLIIFIFLLQPFNSILSQTCTDYYNLNCPIKESKFLYTINSKSTSLLMHSGELHEIPFLLVGNTDYRISICADLIFDNVVKFIIADEQGNELYNNSLYNFKLEVEFSNSISQNVLFYISTPNQYENLTDNFIITGCVGLLIEDMVSVKLGF